jgi:hypothetical protein
MTRKLLAGWLAVSLGVAPLVAQDATGTLGGRAVDEARKPYTNYTVQLRDVANAQIVQTAPLTNEGLFSFQKLTLAKNYLVELVDVRDKKVVCSEGPYLLASPNATVKNDVNIDCGVSPAALWLILAGAGTATAIAVTQASPAQ